MVATPLTKNVQMGANLTAGGATFRVWAPLADEVYVCYENNWQPVAQHLLQKDANGYWSGFVNGITDGMQYKFFVKGPGGLADYKRDPYARELTFNPAFPLSNCIVRAQSDYPWHDDGFVAPAFNDMIIYQFHVGSYYVPSYRAGGDGHFLAVLEKLEYLVALGVNVIEPLPVVEFPGQFSMGYNGTDLFSPEMQYASNDVNELLAYLNLINGLLDRRGLAQAHLTLNDINGPQKQLKALIDICHVYGVAVILDVVYNHAGGNFDNSSIYFFDRAQTGNNDDSQYFTNQGWAGGLVFAFWKQEVRQLLIDNASFFLQEYHVNGFRYDEVSVIIAHSNEGWRFCQDLTNTIRSLAPQALQIAENWPVDPWIVKDVADGGAGFDATWHDGLRDSIRAAISQAAGGSDSIVDLDTVASHLGCSPGFAAAWKSIQYVESHDEVYIGRSPRIPALSDATNAHSWYARSRARVANALVLTAPCIPMLFMGQEFLEDKQWSDNLPADNGNLIWWDGLLMGQKPMVDHLRFMQDIISLRHHQPALRGELINVFHVHNQNRIIAFQRWLDGVGRDVVVVISLNETTFYNYELGFPASSYWFEVFNSDVYDNWVNPFSVGNGGGITASGAPMHGLLSSASVVIPANSIVVFARDKGDK